MKRFLYSIPLFFLLLPWMFISAVILGCGLFWNPFCLLLLLPFGGVMGSAFYVHRQRTKREQHFVAAMGASAILAAPLLMIVVSFFTCGQDLAMQQAQQLGVSPVALQSKAPCEY